MSDATKLLEALLNDPGNVTPASENEAIMLSALTGSDYSAQPRTRMEAYMMALAQKMGGGSTSDGTASGASDEWELISDITIAEDVTKIELLSGDVGYKKLTVLIKSEKSDLNTETGAKPLHIFSDKTSMSGPLAKLTGAIVLTGYRCSFVSIELKPCAVTFWGTSMIDSGNNTTANVAYSTRHDIVETPIKSLYAASENQKYYFGSGTSFVTYGVRA